MSLPFSSTAAVRGPARPLVRILARILARPSTRDRRRRPHAGRPAWWAPVLLLTPALTAGAQDVVLERQPADIVVQVILGAEGRPTTADRVLVREEGPATTDLAEATDVAGEVVFRDQEVFGFRPYLISAWVDGVDYHRRERGEVFLAGEPVVVRAFPVSDSREGLRLSGMNLVVRQQAGGFALEYICHLQAASPPRHTVAADALPLRLALPPELTRREVEIEQGPDPRTAGLRPAGGGLEGVAAPLKPGAARITIRGFLPEEQTTRLPVRFDLPVEEWSLLAWPATLRVGGADLERDQEVGNPQFARWRGPSLAAGQEVMVTIGATEEVSAAPVFGEPTAPDQAPPAPAAPERRFPWLTVIAAAMLLGAYVVWRRRR